MHTTHGRRPAFEPSNEHSSESIEGLLAQAASSSPPRRRQLEDVAVSRSLGLARALAHRYRERGEPLEDLMQVAYTGLVLAVRRFKPDQGARFSTFATPTILGELRRYFRDQTWAIRPPRRMQEDLPRIRQAVSALEQVNGRRPSSEQIAAHLELSAREVEETLQAGTRYRLASLEAAAEGGTPHHIGPIEDEVLCGIEASTTRLAVRTLLDTLDPQEREIIRLRYFEGCTQQQIADRIGVSQMQVSRLLTRILRRLRGIADGDGLAALGEVAG